MATDARGACIRRVLGSFPDWSEPVVFSPPVFRVVIVAALVAAACGLPGGGRSPTAAIDTASGVLLRIITVKAEAIKASIPHQPADLETLISDIGFN